MSLTVHEIHELYGEVLAGKPSHLQGPEADAIRQSIIRAKEEAERTGGFVDVPVGSGEQFPSQSWATG